MKKTVLTVFCIIFVLAFSLCATATETKEVSLGKPYSLVTPASEGYPDDQKKLTDGVYGTIVDGTDGYYASGAYVGFNKANINQSGNFGVIIDLGEIYNNITELTIGYLSESSVGISAPKSVSFSIANERNGNYSLLGTLETTPENTELSATYAKTLLGQNASGRYLLVTITPMGYTDKVGTTSVAPWTFIDEISVRVASSVENNSDPSVTPEGDTSNPNPATFDEQEPETPQTGDSLMIFAFVLLALASLAMMFALFTNTKPDRIK